MQWRFYGPADYGPGFDPESLKPQDRWWSDDFEMPFWPRSRAVRPTP